MSIHSVFSTLTPLQLRRESAHEVFLLINRLNDYLEREAKKEEAKKNPKSNIVRRPAGDNWF